MKSKRFAVAVWITSVISASFLTAAMVIVSSPVPLDLGGRSSHLTSPPTAHPMATRLPTSSPSPSFGEAILTTEAEMATETAIRRRVEVAVNREINMAARAAVATLVVAEVDRAIATRLAGDAGTPIGGDDARR